MLARGSAAIHLASHKGAANSASGNGPDPIVFFGEYTAQGSSKDTASEGSFQAGIVVLSGWIHNNGFSALVCRCMAIVIMGTMAFLVLVAFAPMEMQGLGAGAFDPFLTTADVARLVSSTGMICLDVLILIASLGPGVSVVG